MVEANCDNAWGNCNNKFFCYIGPYEGDKCCTQTDKLSCPVWNVANPSEVVNLSIPVEESESIDEPTEDVIDMQPLPKRVKGPGKSKGL